MKKFKKYLFMLCFFVATVCAMKTVDVKAANYTSVSVNKQYTLSQDGTSGYVYTKFTAPSNGYFIVEDVDNAYVLRVYDFNNAEIMYVYNTQNDITTLEIPCTAGKTYYLNHWLQDSSETLKTTVKFYSSNAWEVESNNTPETANSISPKKTYYGLQYENDSYDYYKIKLSKASKVSVTIGPKYLGGTSSYGLYIWDSDNNYKYLSSSSQITTTTVLLKKGTYYFRVEANSTTPYKIKYTASAISFKKTAVSSVKVRKVNSWWVKNKYQFTKIKLKKYSAVTGYKLQVAKKKNMKSKVINTDLTVGYTYVTKSSISNLSTYVKKGTYYFRVRPYYTDAFGNAIYGSWSSVYKKKI